MNSVHWIFYTDSCRVAGSHRLVRYTKIPKHTTSKNATWRGVKRCAGESCRILVKPGESMIKPSQKKNDWGLNHDFISQKSWAMIFLDKSCQIPPALRDLVFSFWTDWKWPSHFTKEQRQSSAGTPPFAPCWRPAWSWAMEKAIFGFDLFGKWRSRGAGVGCTCVKSCTLMAVFSMSEGKHLEKRANYSVLQLQHVLAQWPWA